MRKACCFIVVRVAFIVFLFLCSLQKGFSETSMTRITSDGKLILNYKNYVAEFFVNVLVTDVGGTLKSDYLQVFFTQTGDAVEKMIAKGHVVIDQKEQHAESGCAQFFSREGKIILTEDPIIRKGENEYAADIITIFTRTNQVIFEPSAKIVIKKSDASPLPLS
jgi:lipopolysaccharide export system protein LptA